MNAFFSIFKIDILIPWLLAMCLGIFVGGIPGLTATMAVALIIPLTFHMPPIAGLAMILGVSFTAIFSGDIPATFLRIPGTPASGAAVLDGYEMNLKGKGPLAIALDLICSAIGGMIGILTLIFIAPILANFALKFTHFEYFWLALLGLSMSAIISKGSKVKGMISMIGGLLISTIGIDISTGFPRFCYGNYELMNGIGFIPVMIGMFGMSEVIRSILSQNNLNSAAIEDKIKVSFRSVGKILIKNTRLIIQSSIIGTIIGALPGAGGDIGAWVAYGVAKKTSKTPEEFGKGTEEGVIAPTSANNAAIGGAWIPALVFGIPGDTITAVVLGAMLMYGLKPGPLVFQGNKFLINQIFSIAFVSQFFLLIIGYLGIKTYTKMFKFPRSIVLSGIILFSIVGSYALRNSIFDVTLVLIFGVLGFYMEKAEIPLAPFILGLILGPMIEDNLRVGMIKTDGSFLPFLTRPISLFLFIILISLYLWDPFVLLIKYLLNKIKGNIN